MLTKFSLTRLAATLKKILKKGAGVTPHLDNALLLPDVHPKSNNCLVLSLSQILQERVHPILIIIAAELFSTSTRRIYDS